MHQRARPGEQQPTTATEQPFSLCHPFLPPGAVTRSNPQFSQPGHEEERAPCGECAAQPYGLSSSELLCPTFGVEGVGHHAE
jgi:hypothetical protein